MNFGVIKTESESLVSYSVRGGSWHQFHKNVEPRAKTRVNLGSDFRSTPQQLCDKLLNFSGPHFLHLQNAGNHGSTYFTELL